MSSRARPDTGIGDSVAGSPDTGAMDLGIFEAYEAVRRARRWAAASQAPSLSRRARQWREGPSHRSARRDAAQGALPRTTDFTEQAVRDLSWLLRSPTLLARSAFGDLLADPMSPRLFGPDPATAMVRLLQRLEQAPAPLAATQASGRERRLGRYAERLFAAWLAEVPALKRKAIGLAVREPQPGGRTLGECDALFETPTGAFEHWELAVKFYLEIDGQHVVGAPVSGQPDLRGCDRYVGAGLADRFDWKLQRLLNHQLPLSAHPALQALAPGPWAPRMFVKGRLFYPLTRWQRVDCGADVPALATDHPRGWWATLSEWLTWSCQADCRWTSLERMDWLAPLRLDDPEVGHGTDPRVGMRAKAASGNPSADGADHGDVEASPGRIYDAIAFARMLHAHFDSGLLSASMPRQVAALTPPIPGQPAREMSRGFIVPDSWPARARVFSRLPTPG
ncbi:DUF1853 family protein [Robbsia andropogonis]|uniref:DUF1853 family protein n=1 Tax=Robbsia andropogonis TaxID=28092 RepID=UPI003D1D5956